MKIIFDAMNCGLGNNGGSLTVIKSANALVNLGHDVTIVDTGKNQHTWTQLEAKHLIVKSVDEVPIADIVIATGYHTVKTTLEMPEHCGLKAHWMRGWELWQMSEDEIIEKVLDVPTVKFVNSICLKDKLLEHGFDSYIVRPGYDFDELYNKDMVDDNIWLGGLYNTRHKTKRTDWVIDSARILREQYGNVRLVMFGVNKNPNIEDIDFYLEQPKYSRKNVLYNIADIWLSATELEGLHIVAAEAMLTKCPVVGTDTPMSGMQDYLIDNETGLVSRNNFNSFVECVETLMLDIEKRKEFGKNAREKVLSLGSREDNMKKFVELMESLC